MTMYPGEINTPTVSVNESKTESGNVTDDMSWPNKTNSWSPGEYPKTLLVNEEKLATGSVTEIAQSADWDAAYWLNKVGPERAGALLTWARCFEQSISDRIRARIAEIQRQAHISQVEEWETKALMRSLEPASTRRDPPKKPVATPAATTEDLL